MEIGKVIRKYRKIKNMTQEEMAGRLGVSGSAVNKWEKGVSYPDIALLAPIARLLGITLDTLLLFQEKLTEEEIGRMVQELDNMLKEKPYENGFGWAKEQLVLYPDCGQLLWQFAVILDTRRLTGDVKDAEQYDGVITQWYTRALESGDEEARLRAAESLAGFYQRKEQYEKAEEYLAYFSDQNPEKKRRQADIYRMTGRKEEAYQAYEELLFSDCQRLTLTMQCIYMLALEDGDMDKASLLVKKQGQLARLFDMGEYQEASGALELAAIEKNEEKTVDIMERMLASVKSIGGFVKSPLYEHMTFKEINEEFLEQMEQKLLECFRDRETFGFLEGNERYAALLGK